MWSKLNYIIFFLSLFIVLCPLILALSRVHRYPKELKVITVHLTAITILGFIGAILWALKKNNLLVLHIYTMIEFTTITLFYQSVFKTLFSKKKALVLIASFVIFCLINAFYIQSWWIFNTYPRTLESIVVIGFSLFYYYRITHQNVHLQIEKSPVFWISTAFFIYFSGGFFLFMLSNYILPLDPALRIMIWQIHAILSIILYILIYIGLWQNRKI